MPVSRLTRGDISPSLRSGFSKRNPSIFTRDNRYYRSMRARGLEGAVQSSSIGTCLRPSTISEAPSDDTVASQGLVETVSRVLARVMDLSIYGANIVLLKNFGRDCFEDWAPYYMLPHRDEIGRRHIPDWYVSGEAVPPRKPRR